MTSFLDTAHVLSAVRAGASGYLLKDILPEDLVQAIISVHNGQSVMHPRVVMLIAANLHSTEQAELELGKSLVTANSLYCACSRRGGRITRSPSN